ncbi:hypothetical protein M9H77_36234 [Catharanthus roseus]|uniref:Uncharacterized protein n=1 Tax=Catharanthus roseus TaxID=4058 RepID=A0ACB9ZS84_CATRO|nr:hypothetical protein M9H77_36234 [Catharanthus roseus]
MVRSGRRRGNDDLGPITNRTGRVHGYTIIASSRGTRGRHSTSDLPATPTPLAPGFHHGTKFFYQMVGAAPHDSSCSTHGYSHTDFGVSSSEPYIGRPADRVCEGDRGFEGDRGLGEEHDRVQALHIEGETDEGGDDSYDDDQDEGEDAGDEEQPVLVVPVAHASGFDERPHHGIGKGLTGNFMSMMSKISGSRNKRPDVARETGPADGDHVDPELIPSYVGHIAGPIWCGQDRGSLKCRSHYMALTGWDLTDAQAWIYLYFHIFAPAVRPGTEVCKPYIQQYPMLGYKNENKLLDIRLRLDLMVAEEVLWTQYMTQEIRACWVST